MTSALWNVASAPDPILGVSNNKIWTFAEKVSLFVLYVGCCRQAPNLLRATVVSVTVRVGGQSPLPLTSYMRQSAICSPAVSQVKGVKYSQLRSSKSACTRAPGADRYIFALGYNSVGY